VNTQIEKKNGTGEDNLNPTPVMIFNPPPADRKCECCRRHIRELQPFDETHGEHCNGKYLIRTFRRDAPYNEEAERAVDEAEEHCTEIDGGPYEWMIAKYGKKKGEILYVLGQASSTSGASWECRDCIILDEDKYFEKLYSQPNNWTEAQEKPQE
jgi:hypothetical protein